MFRFSEDPSPGNLVQCLAKNYKNGFIVSIDMDKVGVMTITPSTSMSMYTIEPFL